MFGFGKKEETYKKDNETLIAKVGVLEGQNASLREDKEAFIKRVAILEGSVRALEQYCAELETKLVKPKKKAKKKSKK